LFTLKSITAIVPSLVLAILAILVWQVVVWAGDLPPILLPSPWAVALSGWETRIDLFHGFRVTGAAALAGFLLSILIGTAMAAVMSQSVVFRLAMYPYVILLQTVPIVAIAPLLVIWSGYEFRTVVLVTVIISLFPIVNGVTEGLLAIPQDRLDLFRLYGASRWQTLWRLRIPTAVQYLMIAAKTSAGLAVIGAIVAEFFVGTGGANYSGLGTLITGWQKMGRTAPLMAALCMSTLLGVTMFLAVQLISRTVLKRWMTQE
jgi:NitT/TauT family transport system permease protein